MHRLGLNATNRGFSTVELIVSLVIFSTIMLVAIPSYQTHVMQVRRAEAKDALHTVMMQEERYYSQRHTYFEFSRETPQSIFKWWSGDSPSDSFYEIHAEACPKHVLSQCISLSAIPGSEQVKSFSDPECGTFILDSQNNKSNLSESNHDISCW